MTWISKTLAQRVKMRYPTSIADALVLIDSAENENQQRDRVVETTRAVVRYLAGLALAGRPAQAPPQGDSDEALRLLGKLRKSKGSLTDGEWVGLARELTRPWAGVPEQHPVPELVRLFHHLTARQDHKLIDELLVMRKVQTVAHGTTGSVEEVVEIPDQRLPQLEGLLEGLSAVAEGYRLAIPLDEYKGQPKCQISLLLRGVTTTGGHWERLPLLPEQRLEPGLLVLVDTEGRLRLPLGPAVLACKPEPSVPEECFFLEGSGRQDYDKALYISIPIAAAVCTDRGSVI